MGRRRRLLTIRRGPSVAACVSQAVGVRGGLPPSSADETSAATTSVGIGTICGELLTALLVATACVALPPAAYAQESQPTSHPAGAEELPERIITLLNNVEDFSYDFDLPAYYALFEFVQHSPQPPGFAREPIVANDWRELIERPADFRGLPITIEGVIGRNKDPYTHSRHPELGQVWQVELRRHDQSTSCTVIFTSDVSDLPLGATIRVTGYFVKINSYPTKSGTPGLAALLVAPGPTEVSRPAPATSQGLDWRWMTVAIVVALVVTVILLRRSTRPARHDASSLRASHAAPLNLADDLADWAEGDPPDADRESRRE